MFADIQQLLIKDQDVGLDKMVWFVATLAEVVRQHARTQRVSFNNESM